MLDLIRKQFSFWSTRPARRSPGNKSYGTESKICSWAAIIPEISLLLIHPTLTVVFSSSGLVVALRNHPEGQYTQADSKGEYSVRSARYLDFLNLLIWTFKLFKISKSHEAKNIYSQPKGTFIRTDESIFKPKFWWLKETLDPYLHAYTIM